MADEGLDSDWAMMGGVLFGAIGVIIGGYYGATLYGFWGFWLGMSFGGGIGFVLGRVILAYLLPVILLGIGMFFVYTLFFK
jgi:hypothetical protein